MKISAGELIDELSKVPPDTEILFQISDGCCGDWTELELEFAEGMQDDGNHFVQIRMRALKGFDSCIKSGKTKEFIESLYGSRS